MVDNRTATPGATDAVAVRARRSPALRRLVAVTEPLDSAAADRVLRRANDLAGGGDDAVDGFEPEALIAAAAEVGIPERAVRQSLAIEYLGPAPTERRLDGLVGPATIVEQRIVAGSPASVLDLLDRWLVDGHHLRRERRRPGEIEWSRRDDVVGGVRRSVRALSGEGRLGDVRRVRATAQPVEPDQTVVRVSVDRSVRRRTSVIAGSTLGGGGAVVGVAGLVLAPPIALAAVPVVAAGGVVAAASRSQAGRFERELLRLLDAVDEGREPQGLLSGIRQRLKPRRSR